MALNVSLWAARDCQGTFPASPLAWWRNCPREGVVIQWWPQCPAQIHRGPAVCAQPVPFPSTLSSTRKAPDCAPQSQAAPPVASRPNTLPAATAPCEEAQAHSRSRSSARARPRTSGSFRSCGFGYLFFFSPIIKNTKCPQEFCKAPTPSWPPASCPHTQPAPQPGTSCSPSPRLTHLDLSTLRPVTLAGPSGTCTSPRDPWTRGQSLSERLQPGGGHWEDPCPGVGAGGMGRQPFPDPLAGWLLVDTIRGRVCRAGGEAAAPPARAPARHRSGPPGGSRQTQTLRAHAPWGPTVPGLLPHSAAPRAEGHVGNCVAFL